jgi:hypothetical protein
MIASILRLHSALNFYQNRILIPWSFSQIFELFHPFTWTIINLYILSFWSWDMTMYLVLLAFTSRQTPFIDKICAFTIESCTCAHHKGVEWRLAPLIFNLYASWKWVVSLVPWQRVPVINWVGVWVDRCRPSMDVWKTAFTTNWRKYNSPVRQRDLKIA